MQTDIMEIRSKQFNISFDERHEFDKLFKRVENYLTSNGKLLRRVFDHLSQSCFATGLDIYELKNKEHAYAAVIKAIGFAWNDKPSFSLILTIPNQELDYSEVMNIFDDGAEIYSEKEMIGYEQLKYLADGGKPKICQFI